MESSLSSPEPLSNPLSNPLHMLGPRSSGPCILNISGSPQYCIVSPTVPQPPAIPPAQSG